MCHRRALATPATPNSADRDRRRYWIATLRHRVDAEIAMQFVSRIRNLRVALVVSSG
jgi:hypothetical protein